MPEPMTASMCKFAGSLIITLQAPVWHEPLLVDEALERLLALDALLLFEVLQLPVNYHRYNKHPKVWCGGAWTVSLQ